MLLYRLLISALAPVLAARFALRWLTGREDGAALSARLGRVRTGGQGPSIWLHAASNGELASVRPVIEALRAERPDLGWLVTTNSLSGRDLAAGWGLPAAVAPLDLRWAATRILRAYDVRLHLTVESELWPNRIAACAHRGVPVAVVGARLSERSARAWGRLPRLARVTLGRLAHVSPQDADSGARLMALGLDPSRLGPVLDLKALYVPPRVRPDPALAEAYPRGGTWLAASTHEGEEEAVIAAHLAAKAAEPGLRLILAPRHPARAEAVARLLAEAGLPFSRRSRGEAGAEVLLADTLGEMAHWYALAGRVFVGGSLVARGGHTPYEPAAFGCALIHGPDVGNFRAAYGRLDAAGAAHAVTDAADLARALESLADGAAQAKAGAAAARALQPEEGLDGLLSALRPLLPTDRNAYT
jgi:3-deoxy-D-manno-octulosonic-acid transferase